MLKEKIRSVKKEEIVDMKASDFQDGDVVECEDYFINIVYGRFDKPDMLSTVHVEVSSDLTPAKQWLRMIPLLQWPSYIMNFIES